MKALLLAAGFGTRLLPLTSTTPKCLVSIGGKPLLQHWLESLAESRQFEKVIINTHYLAEKVGQFFSSYIPPIDVDLSYESKLLGPGALCFGTENNWRLAIFWWHTPTIFR